MLSHAIMPGSCQDHVLSTAAAWGDLGFLYMGWSLACAMLILHGAADPAQHLLQALLPPPAASKHLHIICVAGLCRRVGSGSALSAARAVAGFKALGRSALGGTC
mmetsp:Transcript_76730/g.155969  ORF Transcript_76730/g.155969 Transcript_76730/m.155969 type:complete len:105 (+) Transcript_76730:270-584(+)